MPKQTKNAQTEDRFINPQNRPVFVYDENRNPVTVHPYENRTDTPHGAIFVVQGEHYRQFVRPVGALIPFPYGGDPEVGKDAIRRARASQMVGTETPGSPGAIPVDDGSEEAEMDSDFADSPAPGTQGYDEAKAQATSGNAVDPDELARQELAEKSGAQAEATMRKKTARRPTKKRK